MPVGLRDIFRSPAASEQLGDRGVPSELYIGDEVANCWAAGADTLGQYRPARSERRRRGGYCCCRLPPAGRWRCRHAVGGKVRGGGWPCMYIPTGSDITSPGTTCVTRPSDKM
jgi:hypothetical protein